MLKFQLGYVMAERLNEGTSFGLFQPYVPYKILCTDGELGMYVKCGQENPVLILRENCAFMPQNEKWWIIEPDNVSELMDMWVDDPAVDDDEEEEEDWL